MLDEIREARPLPRSTSTPGASRARSSASAEGCRSSTPTRRRGRSGRARARSATTRTGRSSARRTAGICTSPPTWPTSRQARARVRPAIYVLGADHHGYVARLKAAAAMLGYDPERVEVLIYQLVHIVEGGETKKISKRRGDVVFLRGARGQDRRRRGALVPRLERTRSADRHRRRARRGADAEEPRLLRPVRARADRRDPAERRGRRDDRRGAEGARARGARPDQATDRLPRRRGGGGGAARAARDSDLRDPRRG